VDGQRDEAIAAVPDDLVLQTNLLGDDAAVKDRIRAYRDAGVSTLRLGPTGRTLDERVACLGRVMDLVNEVTRES
jgi:hypothetical protein